MRIRSVFILLLFVLLLVKIFDLQKEKKKLKEELYFVNYQKFLIIDSFVVEEKLIVDYSDSIRFYNPSLSKFETEVYAYTLIKASREFNIPLDILFRLIVKESTWDIYAVSPVGATGLMQVMPQVWKIRTEELKNPVRNIYEGCKILNSYLKIEKGDYKKALYRYSGGAGNHYYAFILRK